MFLECVSWATFCFAICLFSAALIVSTYAGENPPLVSGSQQLLNPKLHQLEIRGAAELMDMELIMQIWCLTYDKKANILVIHGYGICSFEAYELCHHYIITVIMQFQTFASGKNVSFNQQ